MFFLPEKRGHGGRLSKACDRDARKVQKSFGFAVAKLKGRPLMTDHHDEWVLVI
jgi:hypothetical protein